VFRAVHHLAGKYRKTAILLAALAPVLVRISLLPYLPIPEPEVHDEFSYLLGGDTFASGRLTNPAHPMWIHFETFHVNQQPTYATQYPPGQSLFLAAGQRFFGHPWYGVVLGVGLMCGCICWMLQGWLPPAYAFLGSLFVATQFGVTHYWMNSYWGGALAAAGGALTLGALPRLVKRASLAPAVAGAFGAVLLAYTRPYEGLVLIIAALVALLWWRHVEGRPLRNLLDPRLVICMCGVLATGLGWLGYYNYRVSGKPWLMGHVVYRAMYAATPHFWMMPAGQPPVYRHEVIRKFWTEVDGGLYFDTRSNPFRLVLWFALMVFVPLAKPLQFCLLVAVTLARTRKVQIALAICGALALALFMEKTFFLHYYAPAAGLLVFLLVAGWRYTLRLARARSRGLRTAAVLALSATFAFSFVHQTADLLRRRPEHDFALRRNAIIARLTQAGAHNLVLVRYAAAHDVLTEWVYNRADIDGSAIVWAHDMGEDANRELLQYYSERKAWLLEPDMSPPRLTELPPPSPRFSASE
jgi:hypothetical protein